jgi:hypothetical protein
MHRDVTDRNLNSPELLLMFFKVKQKQEGKKKKKKREKNCTVYVHDKS